MLTDAKANFQREQQYTQEISGHGRVERRIVSICHTNHEIRDWSGLKTLIRVESHRETTTKKTIETRYYVSSLTENVKEFYQRLRGYWDVENKVRYVKDVTQGEDKLRIRTIDLLHEW